jgi:hypothetical protein
MAEDPPRATATHQVGHALREVESALRAVLQTERVSGHRESILAILQEMEMSPSDIDAEFWLSIVGQGNARGLHSRAHRPGLDLPRPIDADFRAFVRDFESLLERVLDRFRTFYVEVFRRMDRLLAIESPSVRDAEDLRQRIPANRVSHDHFFRNASAAWIRPLTEVGCFATPPEPQVAEDGSVSFLRWPQSEYLVRMVNDEPDAVLAAALQVPTTDNSYVMWNLVGIAVALPAEAAVELLPVIMSGIPGRYGLVTAGDYGNLVTHFAQAGLAGPALDLARALLSDPPARGGRGGTMRESEFASLLRESIPALTATAGEAVFALLVDALDKTISRSASAATRQTGYDQSLMWRPAIERNDSYRSDDPQNALVDALRGTASQLIDEGRATIGDLVAALDRHAWLIFHRLTLDLLRSHSEPALPLATRKLTDQALASNDSLDREFLLLAQQVLPQFGDRERQLYFRMVDNGPDTATWIARYKRSQGEEPSPHAVDAYVGRWKRDRLAAAGDTLTPDLQLQLRTLVATYGDPPDHAVPPSPTFAVWGDEAVVSVEDLVAMDTHSLIEFLRTWEPPRDWRMIERSSIRGPLSGAVQKDVARRSADAEQFIGLPADYVGSVLDGLWQGAANGQAIDWPNLLKLGRWVNTQAQAELAQGTTSREARQWRRARMGVLRLLITGTQDGPSRLPADSDDVAWKIIRSCADDADPTGAEESSAYDGSEVDALRSDAVRPVAIWAAIAYGQLLRQRDVPRSIDTVLDLLERHLDVAAEPSAAVHAVYGSYIQSLLMLDRTWAPDHLEQIFPPDRRLERLWRAAWDAHLQRRHVTDDTWQLLRPQYVRAVGELEPCPGDEWKLACLHYLGHHLLGRYWFGALGLDDPDRLLQHFYDHAPVDVTRQIMANIGHNIQTVADPDESLLQRLMHLWSYRRDAVEHGSNPTELAEFDQWFTSARFDDSWSLNQLLYVTVNVNDMTLDRGVLARLRDLAPNHPGECLAIIDKWLDHGPNYWDLSFNRTHLNAIVNIGAASHDAATRSLSRTVASNLALSGLYLGRSPQEDAE